MEDKHFDDAWDSAIKGALDKKNQYGKPEDIPMVMMTKDEMLDWANNSADVLLEGGEELPDEVEFVFTGKRIQIEGPLRVVPSDGRDPYYIASLIHQYDDDGLLIESIEGEVLHGHKDIFEHEDENTTDDPDIFVENDGKI